MTAIITNKIKQTFIQQLLDENEGTKLGDSDNYFYIGVGRSQQWDPVANTDTFAVPSNTDREQKQFRYNLQSVKSVQAYSLVVPLVDWTSNTVYYNYNDNTASQSQSFYVRTSDNNVYVCIRQGRSAAGVALVSTVKPIQTNSTLPINADGYVWKYLYTISTADANSFLTANFMPVKLIDSAAATDPYFGQYTTQNAATPGQITGYRVINGGTGFATAPTLSVVGNGTGAKAHAIIAANAIVAVEIGDSVGDTYLNQAMGSDYKEAYVKITGSGTGAEVVPIFSDNGIGKDPTTDLRSTSIMFNIKPEGNVEGKWVVDNDYRQVALLKNLKQYDSAADFTSTQGLALRQMTLTAPIAGGISFANDITVTGESDASAWIDFYDDSSTIWYHQDEATGFRHFENDETITIEGKAGSFTIDNITQPDVDKYSGDLLFVNNTSSVTRDADQTEDIKLVIKL